MKYGNYIVSEENNTSVAKIIHKIRPSTKVIEFGSSHGYILQYLQKNKACDVYGYEIDKASVDLANKNGIPSECIDLDSISNTFFETLPDDIDYIICADVLEHLKNINNTVKLLSHYLKEHPKCTLLVSFPNITYYGVISELLSGNFKYQEVGILDNTHLHFYDKYELEKLFNVHRLEIKSLDTISLEPLDSEFNISLDNDIIDILERKGHHDYLTYQYVLELKFSYNPKVTLLSNNTNYSAKKVWNKIQITQIETLTTSILKKDTQVIKLNKEVNIKDSQVRQLNKEVNRKDSQIIELNKLAHSLQNTIKSLQAQINQLSLVDKVKLLLGLKKK